jgi:hypothetical protein
VSGYGAEGGPTPGQQVAEQYAATSASGTAELRRDAAKEMLRGSQTLDDAPSYAPNGLERRHVDDMTLKQAARDRFHETYERDAAEEDQAHAEICEQQLREQAESELDLEDVISEVEEEEGVDDEGEGEDAEGVELTAEDVQTLSDALVEDGLVDEETGEVDLSGFTEDEIGLLAEAGVIELHQEG